MNHAPTDLELLNDTVAENEPAGTEVGELSVSDVDGGQHAFALVDGDGDDDNTAFAIDGTTLKTAEVFDFETEDTYFIRVRATDSGTPAMWVEEEFTITVNDVNDPPTAVDDSATVAEDSAADAIAVLANDTDADGGPMTIASVVGAGERHGGDHRLAGRHGADLRAGPELLQRPARRDAGHVHLHAQRRLDGDGLGHRHLRRRRAGGGRRHARRCAEDSAATPIDVLANDTDVDGGPMTIASATDPANGTVV